jgi:hypothetical protein
MDGVQHGLELRQVLGRRLQHGVLGGDAVAQ